MGCGNRKGKTSKSSCSASVICNYTSNTRMQVGTGVSETVVEERLSFIERHGYAFVVLVQ